MQRHQLGHGKPGLVQHAEGVSGRTPVHQAHQLADQQAEPFGLASRSPPGWGVGERTHGRLGIVPSFEIVDYSNLVNGGVTGR
jgi:hypothetical protein